MKQFLIVLTALILIGAGYFTYEKWVKHARLTRWSFVPSDAAAVVEVNLSDDLSKIKETPIWNNLAKSRAMNKLGQGLSFLDSINGEGGFTSVFKKMPTLISLHKVSNNSIDYLFVLDIQNLSQNTFVSAAMARLKQAGYRFKTRNYNGFKISEIGGGKRIFTYIFHKNFFLASFTPYLVEDAIRTIDDIDLPSFKDLYKKDQNGSLHINYNQYGNFVQAFVNEPIEFPLVSGSYKLAYDSSIIHLSGWSQPKEWLLNHTVPPRNFEMADIVPSNTSVLYHISSADVQNLKAKQVNYLENSLVVKQLNDSLSETIDYSPEQVFDLVDDEIGLAHLESNRLDDERKLFILKVKDAGEATAYFGQIAERIAYARGDSVYAEPYSQSEIRFFPIQDFPKTLLGDMAGRFERCFYINHKNYLVFSNNLQELKDLVGRIESEETWRKLIHMNDFLSHTNAQANVSIFVNVPRSWYRFSQKLKPKWAGRFKTHEKAFRNIELAAFQLSWIDNEYYTNFTFSQPRKTIQTISKSHADKVVALSNPLISKPYLVRTHAHSSFDILVQDRSNTLYFLDRSFSTVWAEKLDSKMASEIYEMDYYRNGKLQYVFATEKSVHILDRTGAYIPGYPKQLPHSPTLDHLSLIDYAKNRNYRIGITDKDGKVYLTDKNLKILEGWDPIPYSRPSIQPLKHARLGRKDVMISIQENGVVNVANRRGAKMPGFPFNVQEELSTGYHLNPSNSLGASSLNVLSTQGQLLEINLEGMVANRDQLIKESPSTLFNLVRDRREKSFIIIRKEGNTHDVLDATGNLLFSKDYLSRLPILVQYYQLGAGKDLVVFTDTANQSLYIYSMSGNLVTGTPLNAGHEVGIIYSLSKKELQVFTTSGPNLEYYSIRY